MSVMINMMRFLNADFRRLTGDNDLRTYNAKEVRGFRKRFPSVPVVRRLHSKIWDQIKGRRERLDMSTWHTCKTTHCRGGWAVALAGPRGARLENRVGSEVAAAAIYVVSTGMQPSFFAKDDVARADIRNCARREAAAARKRSRKSHKM